MARVGLSLAVAACGGAAGEPDGSTGTSSPRPSAAPTSVFPAYDQATALSMSEPVRFRAGDGVRLAGRVFGSGDVGVVLAHMRPGDQSQWLGFAALLADRGYLVLTYDRRGVCPGGRLGCSDGAASEEAWEDLAYAVDVLRERGATRVVVGGASLGAMESLYALSRGLDADGLIWLSGVDLYGGVPVTEQVRAVHVPKLLAAGEFDSDAAALRPGFERAAPQPVEVVLLDTGEHGTDILEFGDPATADALRVAVLEFLATI